MTLKKYTVKLLYTEHTSAVSDSIVYAHSPEDADWIARIQFLERRRDKPTIEKVDIKEYTQLKDK